MNPRARRDRPRPRPPIRRAALALALLAVPLCWGCNSGPEVRTERGQVVPLASQDLGELDGLTLRIRIASDVIALRTIVDGMNELEATARAANAELDTRPGKYTQAENDQIRALLLSYLNYRTALFRMVAFHSSYRTIADERQRVASFMVYFTAGITLFDKGLSLAQMMANSPNARRKLNEPEPVWGIPPDIFDTVYDNVTRDANLELLSRGQADYLALQPQIEASGLLDDPRYGWMPPYVKQAQADVRAALPQFDDADWVRFGRVAKAATSSVWYAIQAFFADLAGDTRVWPAKARITRQGVEALAGQLQPGDIILARKNFYVSNGFLPGFWPHAILYVGTPEQLDARGLSSRPAIADKMAAYRAAGRDGKPLRVIEAISEGVVFSSLEQVLHSDFAAVLRPRVSEARKDAAIERAFSHLGKPYDFDFDFFTTDKLVCTELVYRAYDEAIDGERLDLQMVRVLGRDTYPAIEFVRTFAEEWARDEARSADDLEPTRQLDFVAFLDGDALRDLDAFIDTADRPSTPERRGFTAGFGGGYQLSGDGALPFDAIHHAGIITGRFGRSIDWSLLLQYELLASTHGLAGRDWWRLGHIVSLQWHLNRVWFLSAGLGAQHGVQEGDPRGPGPLGALTLGYELLQGYSWALDLRAYYHLNLDETFAEPRSAAGTMIGIQFY